ncbi:PTS lactose/cellobiose transporter subunit IIA [Amedibacillus sp. YH-ame6]
MEEMICFQMIASMGEASSSYMEAIDCAKEGKIDEARACITKGEQEALECHRAHANLLKDMANNIKIEVTLLLLHAEDQMMNGELMKLMANELIEVYSKINA